MNKTAPSLYVALLAALVSLPAGGTDIAPVPLASLGSTGSVKPNIMVVLDNSGSMDWDFVGDWVNDQYCKKDNSAFNGFCCNRSSGSGEGTGSSSCFIGNAPFNSGVSGVPWRGHPPFLMSDFNGMAYNPRVVYTPPKNADGSNRNSMNSANTSGWTNVPNDAYGKSSATGNINLTTQFPDTRWCTDNTFTDCLRNDNYILPGTVSGKAYVVFNATVATGSGSVATGAIDAVTTATRSFGPHFYAIVPGEFCTNDRQSVCRAQAAADATYSVGATVRWCSDARLTTCQATKTDTFQYPRYPGRAVAAVATITVPAASTNRSVSSIMVDGKQILSASTSASSTTNTVATRIRDNINACTIAVTGNCTIAGFSATSSGGTVTVTAPLGQYDLTVTPTVTATNFTPVVTAFGNSLGAVPGRFVRVDIIPGIGSYADPYATTGLKHPSRVDCAGATCTYAEEMTNFANWWAYYRTRMQTMKTSLSLSFNSIGNRYQVGLALLSDIGYGGMVTSGSRGMYPAVFSGTNRSDWYTKMFATDTTSSTPLRTALDQMGRMYANLSPYAFTGSQRVVQYACQQNFTLLTTDGYWNQDYSGDVANSDKTENASRFCTRANGCVDPSNPSQIASLADVALYWYNGGSNTTTVSLRPDLEPDMSQAGKVPFNARDPNSHLHMTTYTLGMGVSGNVTYEKNYDTLPIPGGDFSKILNGTANWPQAAANAASAVDDLWHAAINGHGKYFSARTPDEVVTGLSQALASIELQTNNSSASATSTPNISQYDNDVFSSTYTTVKWFGEVIAQKIDASTGMIIPAETWSSSKTLGTKVTANSDTRDIFMISGPGTRKSFTYSAMTAAEKAWFDNKGSTMSQYLTLSAPNQAIANSGNNLVNWLRGQFQYANDAIYRAYTVKGYNDDPQNLVFDAVTNPYVVLGDVGSARPAYVRTPTRAYTLGGYSAFKSAAAGRTGMLYVAANDGMLHAFRASDGVELWAYAPRITMPKLHKQASVDYGSNHQYTVDGTPETGDVQIAGNWKTVLVGGLNSGGRGYYALDVTDPLNPVPLWEFCSNSSICTKNDPDIGLTYGNPRFGKWNGQWVVIVASGLNNTPGVDYAASGGDGRGYLYILDVATGTILKKISTGVGDTTTASGLAKIAAITNDPQTDPVFTYVYAGDTLGNMWRFDLTNAPADPTVVKLAALTTSRPITSKPDVMLCDTPNGKERVVVWGTGRLLGSSDLIDTSTQSFYAMKDTGSPLGLLNASPSMVKQTFSVDPGDSTKYMITSNAMDWTSKNGWYADFDLRPGGERVNIDPRLLAGVALVVTNLPQSSDACSLGGSSHFYSLNVCGYTTTKDPEPAGSLVSATEPAVGLNVYGLPSGKRIAQITTTSRKIPKEPLAGPSQNVRKSSWRSSRNN